MDPDEALRRARKAMEDWEIADHGSPAEWEAAERLSSAFGALDDFLSHGGHLPTAWTLKGAAHT